jgi:hypothetical protein
MLETSNVSEQQAEETRGDAGSVEAGSTVSHASEAPAEVAAALAMSVLESPAIAPDHEAPPKADAPKVEAPKVEPPKVEMAKSDVARTTGKVLIMSPSDRAWHDHSAEMKVESADVKVGAETRAGAAPKAKRSFLATAAMLAFATVAGAIGGALATAGLTHVADAAAVTSGNGALEASIARIDSDILALKAGLEHTSKTGVTQFNKTSDRLDKIEKAQAEPNAKLAKLTEAVDRLRTAPPAAAPAVAAPATAAAAPVAPAPKEVTGSVPPPAAAAAATPPKPEVARLPTVEGWSLADVGYGGALIRNRRGTFEVYAGDVVPGLGRIDAIRKQDGQWVVVTSKGLIQAR